MNLKNVTDESIKYIIFTMAFFNNVGEKENSEIKRTWKAILEYTGELKAGKSENVYWDVVISNSVFWHGNNFYDGGLIED